MNKFIISGRLCADPEINYSGDGKAVAKFNFAVNRRFKRDGEAEADFLTAWRLERLRKRLKNATFQKAQNC